MYDIIIIGAGPAGLTAAIYARRAANTVLVLEASAYGGQIINTPDIENYPVAPNISGFDFATNIYNQAVGLGAEVKFEKALEIQNGELKTVKTARGEYEAKAVIIATGSQNRKLGVEGEDKLIGRGISYCATCDGAFFKNKKVAVVGGGNTALEDALYLADIAETVYLIHRRNELRASKSMQHRVLTNPKIEVIWDSTTKEICGNDLDGVTGADLQNLKTGEMRHIDIAGFFVAIGHKPNTDFVKGQIDLDEQGYIKVANPSSATNIPGVFAAGDVCDPNYRQAIVAAGKGCVAAMDLERFLQNNQ